MARFVPAAILVFSVSCGKNPLPRGDRGLEYGKDAFAVIQEVDREDPSKFLVGGLVGIQGGKMTHTLPGAVFVVGVKDEVLVGGKKFLPRQIILLTPTSGHLLAPPGLTITIPGDVRVFGKTYQAGTFTVPEDSKLPESL